LEVFKPAILLGSVEMKRKNKTWFNKYWILDEKWTKAFFISHIFGWVIATLQTIWIVEEVRRKKQL
jgi:hypothetical protein